MQRSTNVFSLYYIGVLKKYAVFSGRAGRKEFWYFSLFYSLIYGIALIIDRVAFINVAVLGTGPLTGFYYLATLIPSFAVSFRRLHDTGRSGWWFLSLLPISLVAGFIVAICVFYLVEGGINLSNTFVFGMMIILAFWIAILFYFIPLIVFCLQDSQSGENKYGKNPKEAME